MQSRQRVYSWRVRTRLRGSHPPTPRSVPLALQSASLCACAARPLHSSGTFRLCCTEPPALQQRLLVLCDKRRQGFATWLEKAQDNWHVLLRLVVCYPDGALLAGAWQHCWRASSCQRGKRTLILVLKYVSVSSMSMNLRSLTACFTCVTTI